MHDVRSGSPFCCVDRPECFSDGEPPGAIGGPSLLAWCYSRAGRPLPRVERLERQSVPEPYRRLLVHSADMTPTLERFFGQPLTLDVLIREAEGEAYRREVLLRLSGGEPVLYGAIQIFVSRLPGPARLAVENESAPLGRILQSHAIPHLSWPQSFFRLGADAYLADRLRLEQPGRLFGRRNVLVDGSRRMLAQVAEVLAPVHRGPATLVRARSKPKPEP